MGIGQFGYRKLRLVAGRRNDALAHTEDAIEETLIDLHRADMPKRDGQPLLAEDALLVEQLVLVTVSDVALFLMYQ